MEFDADWLPYKLDLVLQRVLWVRLPADARAAAAFLDDRALPAGVQGVWAPLDSLAGLPAPPPADALLHIGHCGSTLLSRVIEAWPGVQALREPVPLRTLAAAWPTRGADSARLSAAAFDGVFARLWQAWSRAQAPAARVVVKATSGCSVLAPAMQAQGARLVLLDMPLAPWLAALMKSPASMADALEWAPERLDALHARGGAVGVALHALAPTQQLALCWLAEQARFDALAAAAPGAVLRVDFHALLDAPARELARVAGVLQLPASGLDAALRAPAWGRYAKAQTHAYDASDRAHDLALSRRQSGGAIDAALQWARDVIARHPKLASAGARIDG